MSVPNPYKAWVNQPSTHQEHNDLHGVQGLCVDDFEGSLYTVFFYAKDNKLMERAMLKMCVDRIGGPPRG
jgi:hypothetical protein